MNKKTLTAGVTALGLLAASCGAGTTEPLDVGSGTEGTITSPTTVLVPDLGSQKLGDTLLAGALNPAAATSSARFEAVIAFSGGPDSEMPDDVEITMTGAYDTANKASELSIDVSSLAAMSTSFSGTEGFFDEELRIVTIGNTSWIQWGLLSIFTGREDMWLETNNDASGAITADFGLNATVGPDEFLKNFAEANARITDLGPETVRGVNTTHYQVLIDSEALASTMSSDERAEFEAELGATPIDDFPVEFWIDDEGLLRRLEVNLADAAFASRDTEDLESGSVTFEMWDYGTDLNIDPPPADQIVTEADLGFELSNFSN